MLRKNLISEVVLKLSFFVVLSVSFNIRQIDENLNEIRNGNHTQFMLGSTSKVKVFRIHSISIYTIKNQSSFKTNLLKIIYRASQPLLL